MENIDFLNTGIAQILPEQTFSISAENPNGEKGGGAREIPDKNNAASQLGQGWKVKPCLTLKPDSVTVLADIKGPGVIRHIWITTPGIAKRGCVLRFYWDGEKSPSVEVPLGDFFANSFGFSYNVNSLIVAVNPSSGMNCYWPMPFKKSARITVENISGQQIDGFFFQINCSSGRIPDNSGYFHAQWRQSRLDRKNPDYVILDKVRGHGHYVGTVLGWTQFCTGWWGEGEVKFYIDSDRKFPTICTTGTEDYFCGAWGFGETFCAPFTGYPLWKKEPGQIPKHALYRWHVPDPVRFRKNLKVTIQGLGWWPNAKYQPLNDELCSVAYWYQTEPHAQFPAFRVSIPKQLPASAGKSMEIRSLEKIKSAREIQGFFSCGDYLAVGAGDDRVAQFAVAKSGANLVFNARVFDRVRQSKPVWTGSSIEIFGSRISGEKNGQVFLAPPAPGVRAKVLRQVKNRQVPARTIHSATELLPDGYEISALVPLKLLGIKPFDRKFLLEVGFNVNTGMRKTVFGSSRPYEDRSTFCTIKVKS